MPDDGPALLSFGVDRAMRALREHAAGRNVIAVLTDSTADQWYRRWERSGGDATQLAIVDCFDFTRGATTETRTNVVSNELVVTELERPLSGEGLQSVYDRFFDGWAESPRGTVVYVESLRDLREDTDGETVESLLERFRARTAQDGSGIVAGVPDDAVCEAVAFGDAFTETVGEPSFDSDAPTAVQRLRATDPTTFGYFRQYWRDAIEILDRIDRSYVQAGQLDTELSSRTLGATLSALAQLDALAVRADTNGPNRYDCRRYDRERAVELGLAVELLPE
ncbi:DUF7504 family protein [Halolamina sp. C58]|uniref:DUF7504 family protein n=1 Tax=Halolamina sp. C58 TaxID=3421640 RepID=UPI003EBD7DF7